MLSDLQKKVLDEINEDEIVRFALALTDIHSPTGSEADAARFCFQEYTRLGLRAKLQEISENRFNAVGELPGTGGGLCLMFNGHLDISHTGKEGDVPGGENTFSQRRAMETERVGVKSVLENGWIHGNGIRNMKSAMAAYVGAVSALIRSGVALKGDIVIAGVSGEIEKAPVDNFQGREFRGYGEGTRFLITHGVVADMCILGEPSQLRLVRGNFGAVWIKLTIRGNLVHTAWSDQIDNCIEKMGKLLSPIREWIDRYQKNFSYQGAIPQVNISAIQGGWPWRMSRTPTYCNLYLDIRSLPGQHPLEIKEEIRKIIVNTREKNPGLEVETEFLLTMPSTEIPEDAPVVSAVKMAHHTIFGQNPDEFFNVPQTDATHLNRYGIPTVVYGPAGRTPPGTPHYVYGSQSVEDLINGARVYALTALDICMRDRKE